MTTRPTKKRKKEDAAVSFHRDFVEPSDAGRAAALGPFPSPWKRPEALFEHVESRYLELNDLDHDTLYQPHKVAKIPSPKDELDWLATVPEPGQGLEQYVCGLTSRSGRLRVNAEGQQTIGLLPILGSDETKGWTGPSIEALAKLTSAFYQRPVKILEAAVVSPIITRTKTASFSSALGTATLEFGKPSSSDNQNLSRAATRQVLVKGRCDPNTKRCQYQVSSLLEHLAHYKDQLQQRSSSSLSSLYCIMGVTLQDLYDGTSSKSGSGDLFCAGMAQPNTRVAVFSFCRYHPQLRMSPLLWYDYGYQKRPSAYSYFEPGQRPTTLSNVRPTNTTQAAEVEFVRRSAKLLLHELGHLYHLEHCIYHHCLMMGTGHLVEDFAAPMHLCGICLRKLQWRLGFLVQQRYQELETQLREAGLRAEAVWVQRELERIQRTKHKSCEQD